MPAGDSVSPRSIDYLQRVGVEPADIDPNASATIAPAHARRLLRIDGIGRLEKRTSAQPDSQQRAPRPITEALIGGLYGYKIPLAFLIQGDGGRVSLHLGTWSQDRDNRPPEGLDLDRNILSSLLTGLYPSIDMKDVAAPADLGLTTAGLALGMPSVRLPDRGDESGAIDRLIRAMSNARWQVLVLAQPFPESQVSILRAKVINEMRTVEADARAVLVSTPLAQHYEELLQYLLSTLTQGQAIGAWRTAVYLLGDDQSYYRLASLWRSLFTGDESFPESIHVWDHDSVGDLARYWAMLDATERPGPAGDQGFRYPFMYQTLLSSAQLAAYVNLPQQEVSGFSVTVVPEFDVVPPPQHEQAQPAIPLGEVQHRKAPTGTPYTLSRWSLGRHAFVTGVTGAGKSKTMLQILRGAHAQGVPFMVIEPAKAEYRALMLEPAFRGKLQVFTLGNERISPFRLNPFEVLPSSLQPSADGAAATYPIARHLDLLRSVFSAGFGMWTPLPQILEQSLYRVYERYGWDLETGTNRRLEPGSDPADAFPTLSDLVEVIDEVTRSLGYEDKITSDMSASLRTRLNALRTGGKGRMLDVRRSFPMQTLLERPTVLELESMGDDDDKAFVMGLLFVRLVEYRIASQPKDDLQHLLVIEEAHRLLTNVTSQAGPEEANPRGKAVESFTNLLSEIRSYGQGVIIVDQVPVRLAPDVIKNTNLKIAHRIVSEDDRQVLAGAMSMNEAQKASLSTLDPGEAAVFEEGADAPVLVAIPKPDQRTLPTDDDVHDYMVGHEAVRSLGPLFRPTPACQGRCDEESPACGWARRLVEDPAFQRALSFAAQCLMEDPEAFASELGAWLQLQDVVEARRPQGVPHDQGWTSVAVHGPQWLAARRGAQWEWTYAQTREFEEALRSVLIERLNGVNASAEGRAFRDTALSLHARQLDPYPGCSAICSQQPKVCLYRWPAADLMATGRYGEVWNKADGEDGVSDPSNREQTWAVAMDAGVEIVGVSGEATDRAGLCFAQQMLATDISKTPVAVRAALVNLLKERDRPASSEDVGAGDGQPPSYGAATSFELMEPDWNPAVAEHQPFAGSEGP